MESQPTGRHRVVVVGGGFGGLQATLALRRAPVDVTLVDRRNIHLFQPLTLKCAIDAEARLLGDPVTARISSCSRH